MLFIEKVARNLLYSSILKNAVNDASADTWLNEGLGTHAHAAKQDALAAIQRLPENVEMERSRKSWCKRV